MTAHERTGERDLWPSTHHRQLPRTFPRSDIDAVWWNYGKPIAFVEEKHHCATWRPNDYTIQVLQYVAGNLIADAHPNGLPAFVVQYEPEQLRFTVTALNDEAAKHLRPDGYTADVYPFEVMLEARYVELQCAVRGMSQAQTAAAVEHVRQQRLPSSTSPLFGNVNYTRQALEQRHPWKQSHPWQH